MAVHRLADRLSRLVPVLALRDDGVPDRPGDPTAVAIGLDDEAELAVAVHVRRCAHAGGLRSSCSKAEQAADVPLAKEQRERLASADGG